MWTLLYLTLAVVCLQGLAQDWNYQVLYDVPFNISCSDTKVNPVGNDIRLMWILPSGAHVHSENQGNDRVILEDNGRTLKIKKIDDPDFGIYYCVVTFLTDNKYHVVKKGINVNGPFWGDLFPKYKWNIIIGCIAGAVVFVIMGVCCFFYDYHIDREEYIDEKYIHNIMQGKENKAMELDEVQVNDKAKLPENGTPDIKQKEDGSTTHL